MIYNFNGEFLEGKNISVSLNNRALNYGDGVFESMKFSHNRINFWEDHYFRLMATMRILRMEIPMNFSPEFLEDLLKTTVDKNGLTKKAARLKILVFRKEGGLYTPEQNDIDYLVTCSEMRDLSYVWNERGLEVDLFKDYYKQKGLLSTLKTTNSQLYTLASIFKAENELDECLLMNDNKIVVEAISANVFILKEEVVYTPQVSEGCLNGVLRKQVLALLKEMKIEVREQPFSPFEIQKAEELFLTNATQGIRWVKTYRKKSFENNLSQALVKRLNIRAALG